MTRESWQTLDVILLTEYRNLELSIMMSTFNGVQGANVKLLFLNQNVISYLERETTVVVLSLL